MNKSPVGALLFILTLMVSGMAAYLNLDLLLYGSSPSVIHIVASAVFLVVWVMMTVYSITNRGKYSFLISVYWFPALTGAAFCVITISGLTRILEYAAYLLLFLLSPLFGLRLAPMTHLLWSMVLTGVSFIFAAAAVSASNRRTVASDVQEDKEPEPEVNPLAPVYWEWQEEKTQPDPLEAPTQHEQDDPQNEAVGVEPKKAPTPPPKRQAIFPDPWIVAEETAEKDEDAQLP